ncbi:hypothetical protein AHF37_02146 [Paragonimus kellicotti]|nr:hypothetical protein AHF37_02146 [Paragonimus kellicotti]
MPNLPNLSPLKGVVAYIDVKSSFGNPALAISSHLQALGAKVIHTLSPSVTHVIFRNGSEVTKQWASRRGVYLITPGWVKSCYMHNFQVSETPYLSREKEDDTYVEDTPLRVPPVYRDPVDTSSSGDDMRSVKPEATDHATSTQKESAVSLPICCTSLSPIAHVDRHSGSDDSTVNKRIPGRRDFPVACAPGSRRLVPLNQRLTVDKLITPVGEIQNTASPFLSARPLPVKKRLSPGAPLTPAFLMDLVGSARTPRSMTKTPGSVLKKANNHKTVKESKQKKVVLVKARMPKRCRNRCISVMSTSESETEERRPNENQPDSASKPSGTRHSRLLPHVAHADNLESKISSLKSVSRPRRRSARIKLLALSALRPPVDLDESDARDHDVQTPTAQILRTQRLTRRLTRSHKRVGLDVPSQTAQVDHASQGDSLEFKDNSSPVVPTHTSSTRSPRIHPSKRRVSCKIRALTNRNSLDDFDLRRFPFSKAIDVDCDQSLQRNSVGRLLISFTGLKKDEEATMCALVKSSRLDNYQLIGLHLSSSVSGTMMTRPPVVDLWHCTHLVTPNPYRRTMNLMRGLFSGVQVVTVDWLKQSAQCGLWLQEFQFRVMDCSFKPPGLPRYSRLKRLPRLFANLAPVYVGPHTKPSRRDLVELLERGGATVTNRQSNASLMIDFLKPDVICVKSTWIFDIVHMVSSLTKNAILRLTKTNLTFIIKERAVYGGVSAWCELDQIALFSERVCEGLSAEQDEILMEVVLDQLSHCLRLGSGGASAGSTFTSATSAVVSAGAVGSSNLMGYTSFGTGAHSHASSTVHGLKIKLVRRRVPCLAFELEQASITGRSRAVWHFIPVHVVPPRLWDEFIEPPDPDFDVSIFFPPIKTLRPFVDRMKRFAKFLLVHANGAGDLNLEVNVETLARVRLTFRGLRARSWLPTPGASRLDEGDDDPSTEEPRSAVWAGDGDGRRGVFRESACRQPPETEPDGEEEADRRFVAVSLDIRRFGQLISSPRFSPSFFVCTDSLGAHYVILMPHCGNVHGRTFQFSTSVPNNVAKVVWTMVGDGTPTELMLTVDRQLIKDEQNLDAHLQSFRRWINCLPHITCPLGELSIGFHMPEDSDCNIL